MSRSPCRPSLKLTVHDSYLPAIVLCVTKPRVLWTLSVVTLGTECAIAASVLFPGRHLGGYKIPARIVVSGQVAVMRDAYAATHCRAL